MDIEPREALRLATHHRYTEQLRVLHSYVKCGISPSIEDMENLEQARQAEELAQARANEAAAADIAACGLAPDEDQLDLLEGVG